MYLFTITVPKNITIPTSHTSHIAKPEPIPVYYYVISQCVSHA